MIVFSCFLWMCIRGPVDTRGMNMLPFFFGPWIECCNMDWMHLELAKLGWSLAEVIVDVYHDMYRSLLCAVKCRCTKILLEIECLKYASLNAKAIWRYHICLFFISDDWFRHEKKFFFGKIKYPWQNPRYYLQGHNFLNKICWGYWLG